MDNFERIIIDGVIGPGNHYDVHSGGHLRVEFTAFGGLLDCSIKTSPDSKYGGDLDEVIEVDTSRNMDANKGGLDVEGLGVMYHLLDFGKVTHSGLPDHGYFKYETPTRLINVSIHERERDGKNIISIEIRKK